jgi:hypothetical protein
MEGEFSGGRLTVNGNLTRGRLVVSGPVTCFAYAAGACDQAPYDSGAVSINLTWRTSGPVTTVTVDSQTCLYRYGQATGSILLGDVNVLAADGGTILSDPTETNVWRCTSEA